MSYSGSHHQFGHTDLQLLQNRVMVARLQELQKQQQRGQLGDVKSQSPTPIHLSRFGKQASGGQVPNSGGGIAANSSDIFAANNLNWMHHNVSSPVQGFSSNSYLHDQGLMMNPSLYQTGVSYYGTNVASGRTNMGHFSPFHGVTLQGSPHANSLQKNMSLFDYSGMHGQPNGTGFLHEKSKHPSDSQVTAELDPLEEKILFDTENCGWDSSLSKLAALDVEEFANSSETMNPFSSVQSGTWSALMQSAVAEVSSSDTGVQEELSGLSYQNMELSTDNQPSNLVAGTSSSDSIMSSALPHFQQTGLQSNFELGLNKFSTDINIEQWSHISQPNQQVPSKHVRNDWQADVFRGSGSSVLSASDTNQAIYGLIQHRTSDHEQMSIADDTLNQKENKSKSPRYDETALENGPMSVDAANKNAGLTYASQNYQGENSSDSYNSKVSHAYTAQPDHAGLNPADSESSARSSQKSPNQVKQNQSEDVLSKCSPSSNIFTAMDSINTPEQNKANFVSDHGGTTQFGSAVSPTEREPSQDIFSFQSSVFGDSVPANSRNEQKVGQTWWMPSSFGPSVPALQGALAQNWSAKSHGSIFPGPLCAANQVEGKSMSDMSVPSESISKKAEMSQLVSLSGSSWDSCLLENASLTGLQNYVSGALQKNLSYMSHINQLGMKPHSVQTRMLSQRDLMVDPCKVSYNLHDFSTPYFNGKDQSSSAEPSAQKSENVEPELDPSLLANTSESDVSKGSFNSHMHASILSPGIYNRQRIHQAHMLASNQQGQSTGNNNGYDVFSNLSSGAQTASALCKQYEGTKPAQILSPFDASRVSSARQAETFHDGGMSCILASPVNQTVSNQQVLASSMIPTNADNMSLILSKSRKRKFSAYVGLPWHVEVMQSSWKLPDIRVAEQGWAKATNRLVERVNENDTLEEMSPVAHGKKRLILTSQLMQQVFQPPLPSILRVDAASDYELLVYFVAKVELVNVCKLTSKPRIHTSHEYGDMLINASSNAHNSLMKGAEVLVERAMKLESQIEGLDASFSTVDIRRECQELEKCSLINHFAKYHGRLTQSNATDTHSPFLRRYVSPILSPQKLPEATKCLSL